MSFGLIHRRRSLHRISSGCGILLATPYDDNYDCGGVIDQGGVRFTGANPWTLRNARTGTYLQGGGKVHLAAPASGNAMDPLIATQPLASGNGRWRTRCGYAGTVFSYHAVGMVLRESGTGKTLYPCMGHDFGFKWGIRREVTPSGVNDYTTWNSNYYPATAIPLTSMADGWIEIVRDGANFLYYYSADGTQWYELTRSPELTDFTTAADLIGIFMNSASTNAFISTGDFFDFKKNDMTLPYGVPIRSPGAEQGAVGWTIVTGNAVWARGGVGRGGGTAFAMTGNPGAFESYIEWIPVGWDPIWDAGTHTATLSGWGSPWTGASTSYHIEIEALTSGNVQLATASSGTWTPTGAFTQKSCNITIPATTRKFRIHWKGTTTASDDGWLDDLVLTIT